MTTAREEDCNPGVGDEADVCWENQEDGKNGISFLGTKERRNQFRRLYIRKILTKIFGIGSKTQRAKGSMCGGCLVSGNLLEKNLETKLGCSFCLRKKVEMKV